MGLCSFLKSWRHLKNCCAVHNDSKKSYFAQQKNPCEKIPGDQNSRQRGGLKRPGGNEDFPVKEISALWWRVKPRYPPDTACPVVLLGRDKACSSARTHLCRGQQ